MDGFIYLYQMLSVVTPCYQIGLPFAIRITVILCVVDSTTCYRHSTEILVQVANDANRQLHISQLYIHDTPEPKDAVLDRDLATVEAIREQLSSCHIQETSLRWFELSQSLFLSCFFYTPTALFSTAAEINTHLINVFLIFCRLIVVVLCQL